MCCDHLVCARCARPVAEAACPVCRSARAELHGQPVPAGIWVAALVAVLGLALLLAGHLG